MSRYRPEPPTPEGARKTAVVLVNLGTPDAPAAPALRRYLAQFLSDPRVVEIPRALWWPILHGIILRIRPAKSAAKYASIWQAGGSPLRVHTEAQVQALQALLDARGHHLTVRHAMRYGQPALDHTLDQLKREGHERILILPLYPQYAASTTATVMDDLARWLLTIRNQPELRSSKHFHDHPGYIRALAASVRQHWAAHGALGTNGRLLLSFHGLPRRSRDLGDPYHAECLETARLLRTELGLDETQMVTAFQSRFGKAEWLQPYTAATAKALGKSGISRLDVLCPGFVADCLETLEEIAQEVRDDFVQAGGQDFHYIPCLNASSEWMQALADLTEQHLAGWETRQAPANTTPQSAVCATTCRTNA